jgi:malyl-CoA/(S)-citramalyl-CoA lyase
MKANTKPSLKVQRSLLAVPALSPRFFEKAAKGDADSVFLDLEDSVPPSSKVMARRKAIKAINEVDWGEKSIGLRVNALETKWGLRDIIESITHCRRLDFIVLPRVEHPFDVQHVDALLSGLERETGRSVPISLHAIIETPLGLTNVEAIAGTASRMDAISFGFGDFSISMGTYESLTGGIGEQWAYALARIATACKAHGLRPIDGPYTNFGDIEGLRTRATLAARHGFEGKWAIHPSQIATCRDVFSLSEAHVEWARATLAALEPAVAAGTGAIGRNGQLLDMAHVRLANDILSRAAHDEQS